MYVWERAVLMTDGDADDRPLQMKMLQFCRRPAINVRRIYFLVDFERTDFDALADLLRRARRYDVEVFALNPGGLQNEWARRFRKDKRCDHAVVLRWIDQVLGFESPFDGIQLDIELHTLRPHRRRLWRNHANGLQNRRNRALALQYLELLDRIRLRLNRLQRGQVHTQEQIPQLTVTLPVWYDKPEDYNLNVHSRKAPLLEHVQDRVDFITLMNYVADDSPTSIDRAVRNIQTEIEYGPVESMFETAKPRHRRGAADKASTLYRAGLEAYQKVCASLRIEFRDNRNFVGCAAHHYGDAIGSHKHRWQP